MSILIKYCGLTAKGKKMKTKETINYLTYDQAIDLVERIAKRCEDFTYYMGENEKQAMANLLSDIGVTTSDLIDVSNLADNYAINAEIINGDKEAESYSRAKLDDALFTWVCENTGETCYCLSW